MAPGKRQVKARRHLVCNHCHSLVDFAVSGCGKTWSETTEEGFTFQCLGCWKVDCLTAELASDEGKGTTFRNCKRMAVNGQLEQMCEEEGVGFVDLWGYFVGKEDMFMRDGLHLSGKGAAVFSENLLRSMNNGTGCNFLN